MLKLVSDENFNGDILRGLYRQRPELDVVRVQDVGLEQFHFRCVGSRSVENSFGTRIR